MSIAVVRPPTSLSCDDRRSESRECAARPVRHGQGRTIVRGLQRHQRPVGGQCRSAQPLNLGTRDVATLAVAAPRRPDDARSPRLREGDTSQVRRRCTWKVPTARLGSFWVRTRSQPAIPAETQRHVSRCAPTCFGPTRESPTRPETAQARLLIRGFWVRSPGGPPRCVRSVPAETDRCRAFAQARPHRHLRSVRRRRRLPPCAPMSRRAA